MERKVLQRTDKLSVKVFKDFPSMNSRQWEWHTPLSPPHCHKLCVHKFAISEKIGKQVIKIYLKDSENLNSYIMYIRQK